MPTNPLDLIPDINFTPKTVDEIIAELTADYEAEYFQQTGERKTLAAASPERIYLYTEASRFYAAYQMIDHGCKMNLLKYAVGSYLDNLAALYGLSRLPAQSSVTRMAFELTKAQDAAVVIKQGTRVSTATQLFFKTTEDLVIPAGEVTGICDAEALSPGISTAGFLPGQVNILVDPVPYVGRVRNQETTQGGADVETDEHLRLRIYYYPRSLSVAGPTQAYEYFISSYSQAIEGISVYSPTPGVVDARITLQGGVMPTDSFIAALVEYLEDKRPLTDQLTIAAPEVMEYAVKATFYIAASDGLRKADIISAVTAAAEEYTAWQSAKIGRDLSPDMLTRLTVAAGAKRVPIVLPVYTPVPHNTICRCAGIQMDFGGMEDD